MIQLAIVYITSKQDPSTLLTDHSDKITEYIEVENISSILNNMDIPHLLKGQCPPKNTTSYYFYIYKTQPRV